MPGHLLVSISSIFADTRSDVKKLLAALDKEDIPVTLLVAPHIGHWHLSKDKTTRHWLKETTAPLVLNGFDQAVQGRRAEFANLNAHEARLRLKGATRQMATMGFDFDVFAPPRWRMSSGTLEVLPEFNFALAASTKGVHRLGTQGFEGCRNLSFGEGYGAAKWWRRYIVAAAQRGAAKGNTIRLSVSGRNLEDKKTMRDFLHAATAARDAGAVPADYRVFLR